MDDKKGYKEKLSLDPGLDKIQKCQVIICDAVRSLGVHLNNANQAVMSLDILIHRITCICKTQCTIQKQYRR